MVRERKERTRGVRYLVHSNETEKSRRNPTWEEDSSALDDMKRGDMFGFFIGATVTARDGPGGQGKRVPNTVMSSPCPAQLLPCLLVWPRLYIQASFPVAAANFLSLWGCQDCVD